MLKPLDDIIPACVVSKLCDIYGCQFFVCYLPAGRIFMLVYYAFYFQSCLCRCRSDHLNHRLDIDQRLALPVL